MYGFCQVYVDGAATLAGVFAYAFVYYFRVKRRDDEVAARCKAVHDAWRSGDGLFAVDDACTVFDGIGLSDFPESVSPEFEKFLTFFEAFHRLDKQCMLWALEGVFYGYGIPGYGVLDFLYRVDAQPVK